MLGAASLPVGVGDGGKVERAEGRVIRNAEEGKADGRRDEGREGQKERRIY